MNQLIYIYLFIDKIQHRHRDHSLNKTLSKSTNYANAAYDANLPSKNNNNNNHINEILKVQRQPNKIIITELVSPNSNGNNNIQHQQQRGAGGEGFQKKISFDSSSNETLAQNNAYPHFEPHMTRKQQQNNNKHFQSTQAQATFQPASKTPSFRRAEQADCNNTLCEKSSSSNAIQTHYIIQPDPNFDTKIIDGLLKQKKLSDFEENKF